MISILLACTKTILKPDEVPDFPGVPEDTDTGTNTVTDTGSCTEPTCDGVVVGDRETDASGVCVNFSPIEDHGIAISAPILSITAHDVDGDHNDDIFVAAESGASTVFLSNGNGSFTQAHLFSTSLQGQGRRGLFADYSGDGVDDFLYLYDSGSLLFYAEGGSFVQVDVGQGFTIDSGRDALWLGSGYLVATENGTRYYDYQGAHIFVDATSSLGLTDYGSNAGLTRGDFNSDGHNDVFVANTTGQNRLFKFDGVLFTSVEEDYGISGAGNSPATDALWFDYDGDGNLDLSVANYDASNEFYINDGSVFLEAAAAVGLQDQGPTVSLISSDLAGDDYPWLHMTRFNNQSLLYRPILDDVGFVDRYEDVSDEVGVAVSTDGMQSAFFDFDHDSDEDLILSSYENGALIYKNESFEFDFCR